MFQNIVNKFFMVLSVTLALGGLAFAFSNAGSSPCKANCCNAGACCPDTVCCPDGACCPNNACCEDGTCTSIAKVAKKVNCCPDGACCPTGPCCEVVKN